MRALLAALPLLWASPAFAQHTGHEGHQMPMEEAPADPHADHAMPMEETSEDPHAGHRMPMNDEQPIPTSPPPAAAQSGPEWAAETVFPAPEIAEVRRAAEREMGGMTTHLVMLDRLEWQAGNGEDALLWDANGWLGDDIDKLWIKSEGEIEDTGTIGEAEVQALWSHAIGPWFDLQAGVRYDVRPRPDRAHLVLGVQGLAPYFFELDAAAFLSNKGDLTARIEAEYDQRITQRLIAQPRAELYLSAQDVPELGLGHGVTSLQAGLRLRYEFVREFAPYFGVEWQREFGETARFTRMAGGDADRIVFVAGLRAWF